jgi:hypothetical protein
MNRQLPSHETPRERLLGERLRCEAAQSRPAFSESLHEQAVVAIVRRAVRLSEAGTPTRPRSIGGTQPGLMKILGARRVPATIAAATVVLLAVTVGWRWYENAARRGVGTENAPASAAAMPALPMPDDLAEQAISGLDGLLTSVAITSPSARLEQDFRTVADGLTERLPVELMGDGQLDRQP